MTNLRWVLLAIVTVMFLALTWGVIQYTMSSSFPFHETWQIVIYVAAIWLVYLGFFKVIYRT